MRDRQTRRPSRPSVRGLDPLGPLLAAVGGVVFVLHGYGGILTRDLALYAYSGQQFAEGVPPFEAVMNRAGPLAHMVPGVATWLGRLLGADSGYDDLMVMRVFMTVLSVVAVWVVYLLCRDAFASRLAGVAGATSLLAFQGFVTYSTGGPREKTTMMLLMALALLALVHRRFGWAGVCVALATLTWQPVFIGGASAALAAALLVRGRRGTLEALVRFGAGGLATLLVFVLYFTVVGSLRTFWDAFYAINATYTRQTGLLAWFEEDPGELMSGFGWSLWLILLGLAAMVALGAVRVRRVDRDDRSAVAVVALAGGTLVSLLWSFNVFNGWADGVFMLPFAAAGLAGLVHLVATRVGGRESTGRAGRRTVAVVAAYAVVVTVAAAVNSWATRDDRFAAMTKVNEDVLTIVGPDATFMSVGSPQPLVYGRERNIIYHQMFIAGLQEYVDDTWPGGLDGIGAVAEEQRPTVVTVDKPEYYPFIRPVLAEHYVELGETYLMTWYVDASLPAEELERLRAAVDVDLPE